jgi:hypothetical protein
MMNKWNNMTPEEREKLKQEWQKRCGGWGHRSWAERTTAGESGPGSEGENIASKI